MRRGNQDTPDNSEDSSESRIHRADDSEILDTIDRKVVNNPKKRKLGSVAHSNEESEISYESLAEI